MTTIRNISTKTIFASCALVLFAGCSAKICGVDEEVFKSFDRQKQAAICQEYVAYQKRIEEYNAKRALIEEQNRKKMLENENIKLKALYARADRCQGGSYVGMAPAKILVAFRGAAGYSKKKLKPLYPKVIRIVDGEAKKVCLQTAHSRYSEDNCFWIAMQNGNLYIDIDPDPAKSWMERYVIAQDVRTNRDTIVLPVDSVVSTTAEFYANGRFYRLSIKLSPDYPRRLF